MKKDKFIDKWEYLFINDIDHDEYLHDLETVIQQAISEHEAGKWRNVNIEIPDEGQEVNTLHEDGSVRCNCYFGEGDWLYDISAVIKWRKLPAEEIDRQCNTCYWLESEKNEYNCEKCNSELSNWKPKEGCEG